MTRNNKFNNQVFLIISAYNRENILLGKYSVPVSRSYKEKVLQDLR